MKASQLKESRERQSTRTRSTLVPRLRILRVRSGLSQRDLAKVARVSPTTVLQAESGRRGVYPTTLRKLASAFSRLTPGDLVSHLEREEYLDE